MTLILQPYGLSLSLAFLTGWLYWKQTRRKSNLSETELENLILLSAPLALIGARIYHVLTTWSYYQSHPSEIFWVWQGGLGIFGALTSGALGVFIFAYLKRLKPNRLLNWLVVPLPLMQAIGRLGNVFNHELLPFAYFEIGLNLGIFTLLQSQKIFSKQPLAVYLTVYGLGRFVLEFTRADRLEVLSSWGLGLNQIVSLPLILIGVSLAIAKKSQPS